MGDGHDTKVCNTNVWSRPFNEFAFYFYLTFNAFGGLWSNVVLQTFVSFEPRNKGKIQVNFGMENGNVKIDMLFVVVLFIFHFIRLIFFFRPSQKKSN